MIIFGILLAKKLSHAPKCQLEKCYNQNPTHNFGPNCIWIAWSKSNQFSGILLEDIDQWFVFIIPCLSWVLPFKITNEKNTISKHESKRWKWNAVKTVQAHVQIELKIWRRCSEECKYKWPVLWPKRISMRPKNSSTLLFMMLLYFEICGHYDTVISNAPAVISFMVFIIKVSMSLSLSLPLPMYTAIDVIWSEDSYSHVT